jgi:hypothetical protein
MIYHDISSEVIIAKIENSYTITSSTDWVNRAPEWIADAMAIIDMPLSYKMQEPYEMEISGKRGKLPCNVERVLFITKDGKAMSYIVDGAMLQPNTEIELSGIYYYEYTKSGHIMCNFTSGTVYVYYKGLDSAYNKLTGLRFPYIPYNRVLLNALEYYVLFKILQKGGAVLGFNLSDNNEFTNPALAWKLSLKAVRISLLDDYSESMENIDNASLGFLRPTSNEKDKRDYLNLI